MRLSLILVKLSKDTYWQNKQTNNKKKQPNATEFRVVIPTPLVVILKVSYKMLIFYMLPLVFLVLLVTIYLFI